ncbi:MAG: hypothetical protein U0T81_15540 [Saprospiraceae bacterium]
MYGQSSYITIPADTIHPVFTPKDDTITCAHPDALLSSGFKGQFKSSNGKDRMVHLVNRTTSQRKPVKGTSSALLH